MLNDGYAIGLVIAGLIAAVPATLAAKAAMFTAKQTRPSNGTSLATMIENHIQHDAESFAELTRRLDVQDAYARQVKRALDSYNVENVQSHDGSLRSPVASDPNDGGATPPNPR